MTDNPGLDYIVVEYNIITYTAWQWSMWETNEIFGHTKAPPISPLIASCRVWVPSVSNLGKNYVINRLYWDMFQLMCMTARRRRKWCKDERIYEATCSWGWEEAVSWCFITSGSSGGVDRGATSKGSKSPSEINQSRVRTLFTATTQLPADGLCIDDVMIGQNFEIGSSDGIKCWFMSLKPQESHKWSVHRIHGVRNVW